MPTWSPVPPPTPQGVPLRIVRTPAAGSLTGIVTSPDLTGCRTHYVGHRTVPCEWPAECSTCSDGYSWRWHAYCGLLIGATLEHVILELTAQAADPLRNYYELHGNLRGCKLTARRPSGHANGRIVVACTRIDEQRIRLPDPPNVHRVLCHVWGVRYVEEDCSSRDRPPWPQVHVAPSDNDARYQA